MSKEMEFFIFLIEQYAFHKHSNAQVIMKNLEKKKLTEYVLNMYERYHTESLDNAFKEIDNLIGDTIHQTLKPS